MGKILFIILLLCSIISCSDDGEKIVDEVSSGALWKFHLGSSIVVENRITIVEPAFHAVVSEIRADTVDGGISYFYMSEEGFTGVEKITIESAASIGDDNYSFIYKYFIELRVR